MKDKHGHVVISVLFAVNAILNRSVIGETDPIVLIG